MHKAVNQLWYKQTFKREFALISFGVWVALTLKVFYYSDVAVITALGSAYGTASTSIWLFILSAFGMDFAAKQLGDKFGSGSMRETQFGGYQPSMSGERRPRLSPSGRLPDER